MKTKHAKKKKKIAVRKPSKSKTPVRKVRLPAKDEGLHFRRVELIGKAGYTSSAAFISPDEPVQFSEHIIGIGSTRIIFSDTITTMRMR